MIVTALLLATIGAADLTRDRFRGPRGIIIGAIVGIAVATLGAVGLGLPVWAPCALIVVLTAWLILTDYRAKPRLGYWPLALLATTTLGSAALVRVEPMSASAIAQWYQSLPYAFAQSISLVTFMLAVGGIVFLFESANVVVRIVLPAQPPQTAPDAAAPAAPTLPPRRRWFAAAPERSPQAPTDPAPTPLKGGRLIGPLERLFILALALAGQFTAIGAVIAAKGIIRFPEISRDDARGSKAEYFLVGSFASWAMVLFVAVLLALSR